MLPKVTKIKIDEARALFKEKIKFTKIEQRTFLELLLNRKTSFNFKTCKGREFLTNATFVGRKLPLGHSIEVLSFFLSLFCRFPSHVGHCGALSRISCAVRRFSA